MRYLIDNVGTYYRWFYVNPERFNYNQIKNKLHNDIFNSSWIDGLCNKVYLQKKTFFEISEYMNIILYSESESRPDCVYSLIDLIQKVIHLFGQIEMNQQLSRADYTFIKFAQKNLVVDEDEKNLPVPVFTYIKPQMGHQFILHILLSLGRFETEADLTLHRTLRDSLRYAKLIGDRNDESSLRQYSNQLLKKFIEDQLIYFPNSYRTLDTYITYAAHLFDDIIIKNEIPITDLPPVLQSNLFESVDIKIINFWNDRKLSFVKAALTELRFSIELCEIPNEIDLINSSKSDPLDWNPINTFRQSSNQSYESYLEQKFAISTNITTIKEYMNIMGSNAGLFTKSIGTHGAPGSGKSFTTLYSCLYAISQGLKVISTSVMSRQSVHLGGIHIHKLFCLDVNNKLSPQRLAELAFIKCQRNAMKLNILQTVNIIFLDEAGQLSAELVSVLDMILRTVRNTNIPFGGVLFLLTMDHTQLAPINGKPFLISSHVLSCFKMVRLECSVRASVDNNFQRLQQIACMHPSEYETNPSLLTEFKLLASETFTFVNDWNAQEIDPNTYRLYGRKKQLKMQPQNISNMFVIACHHQI